MQTKEDSFIKKFISSIKDFEKYPEMASKPFGRVFSYMIKLMLIFTFIVTVISVFDISKNINSGIEYFKNQIPDIEFANNELKVDSKETITISPNSILERIIINTNDIEEEQLNNYINDVEKYNTSAIVLKDRIIVNTELGTITYKYEEIANIYNIGNMTKQEMLNYFTGTNLIMIYIAIFIMSFLWLLMAYLTSIVFDIILYGAIGYVTALILRVRIRFTAMIKIAIYSLTLPIVLNLIYIIVHTLFGFEIKYFEIMYMAITYIYIITAILMIKSDLIKRGQELTKIIEEEQRVKAELERQKEEQKEKEEEDRKRKQEEKKRQEKKEGEESEKEGLQGEPQGDNA